MLYLIYIPYIPYTCYIENPRSPAPAPAGEKNVPRPIPTKYFQYSQMTTYVMKFSHKFIGRLLKLYYKTFKKVYLPLNVFRSNMQMP